MSEITNLLCKEKAKGRKVRQEGVSEMAADFEKYVGLRER